MSVIQEKSSGTPTSVINVCSAMKRVGLSYLDRSRC